MKIAIFSDSYTPIVNGVSVSIEGLVNGLRSEGHSVHIFTSNYPGHKDSDPNVYRFRSLFTPWTKGYPLAIPPFYGNLKKFRKNDFDLIHTHTPFTMGFIGLRWAESHGLPIVSTYHTLYEKYAHYIPFFPKRYCRYKIAKHTNYYFNRCAEIIAPSEAARKSLIRHKVNRPINVIPSGNPTTKRVTKQDARLQMGLSENDKVLLYVGRIAKEKNMLFLLEAVSKVMRQKDQVKFLLVGDGPYRNACNAFARELGIGDKVTFVGPVPRSEVDNYYLASDLFVFASMTETQGLVVGEAMACGVPAVAVHGGGASDGIIEGENGFIVPNNVSSFSDRVLDILNNPALHGRISEGARKSVRKYTSKEMTAEVLKVYERVLNNQSETAIDLVKNYVAHS